MAHSQPLAPPPAARLTLTTLGQANLALARPDTAPTVLFGPGKPLALLAYLAFSPRRTAGRDHLVDLLWADSEPDRAMHAMRQTVWQIRHVLGEEILITRPGEVALAAEIDSDRDAFLAAVASGDLERAVALYTGDFLPDFAAPGGASFEQWADLERIRLRTAFLRSAESLARRYLAAARVREAQRLARRARDTEPHQEGGWRLLLETLEAGNDWTAAAMEADALEHLLRTEEREPEPATRAAIRRARRSPDEAAPAPRTALVAELVGREREFAAILAAWDESRRGSARHVHVLAAAGLGKTRLLQDVHARLRAAGARAVYARANPGERGISCAFAAEVAAVLAALPGAAGLSPGAAAALVSLNPTLSARYAARADSSGGDDLLRHRSVALSELLAAVSDDGPIALLLDDLHWADPASRQLLAGLVARLPGHRALLVTTSRPAAETVLDGASATILLPPLDERQVAALIASIAVLPDAPWARDLPGRLAWASGGSPLLLLESLQLALEREVLHIADGAWSCPDAGALAGGLGAGSALRRRLEELGPTEGQLILTLAVAGTPIGTGTVQQAAGRPVDIVVQALAQLEERGLVNRMGQGWECAHDELAALAVGVAAADTLRATRTAVGRALAEDAVREPGAARHAASLLAQAGDETGLGMLFREWVAMARAQRDDRDPDRLAQDLLGDEASETRIRLLVKGLPWRTRLGRRGRRRAATAVGAVTALGVWMIADGFTAPVPADAVLYVVEPGQRTPVTRRIEIRAAGWRAGEPLPRGEVLRRAPWSPRFTEAAPVPSPDGLRWAGAITANDSGGLDLFLSGADGRLTRLTAAKGDDVSPSWAPDGSAIAFSTARWHPLSRYDLAILDLGTGEVRPLTSGDPSDQGPSWSPDGSRIVFTRTYYQGRRREICWITTDGAALDCRRLDGVAAEAVWGWLDHHRVLAEADSNGRTVRRTLDVTRGTTTALPLPETGHVDLSPDGEWLLFRGILSGTPRTSWLVAPARDPTAVRELPVEATSPARVVWAGSPHLPRYLDRLEVQAPETPLPIDGVHHLQAEGFDQSGRTVPALSLKWRSADTNMATIDSSGMLRPRRTGTVMVYVTAGGWRSDSARFTIGRPSYTALLSESWRGDLFADWIPFGEPRPIIVNAGTIGSLWNRGDSSFRSGVYSRRVFSAAAGLGVEVTLTAPLTAVQWQEQEIRLDPTLDSAALAAWDHRTGAITKRPGDRMGSCVALFPDGEGPIVESRLWVARIDTESRQVPVPEDLRTGAPHRLRVQILADGRCGVAVDGRAVWVSRGSVPLDRPFNVVLEGKSHGTRVLVGDVEVWRGVRADVDWRGVE